MKHLEENGGGRGGKFQVVIHSCSSLIQQERQTGLHQTQELLNGNNNVCVGVGEDRVLTTKHTEGSQQQITNGLF